MRDNGQKGRSYVLKIVVSARLFRYVAFSAGTLTQSVFNCFRNKDHGWSGDGREVAIIETARNRAHDDVAATQCGD